MHKNEINTFYVTSQSDRGFEFNTTGYYTFYPDTIHPENFVGSYIEEDEQLDSDTCHQHLATVSGVELSDMSFLVSDWTANLAVAFGINPFDADHNTHLITLLYHLGVDTDAVLCLVGRVQSIEELSHIINQGYEVFLDDEQMITEWLKATSKMSHQMAGQMAQMLEMSQVALYANETSYKLEPAYNIMFHSDLIDINPETKQLAEFAEIAKIERVIDSAKSKLGIDKTKQIMMALANSL